MIEAAASAAADSPARSDPGLWRSILKDGRFMVISSAGPQ
ncbi:hypothetical protein CWATWH0402_6010 [Crocosphaera watsonii WH 0402]|uniref:Uncharacterized protein n=1 Tax=Crocosphaera watsonii WH 0402 TaxID=1284629 RepID=T2JPJ0_CROWT|nr:hypothetical protein CWATWH0402_6010 [Crocosphaera watsonii WH 0402]